MSVFCARASVSRSANRSLRRRSSSARGWDNSVPGAEPFSTRVRVSPSWRSASRTASSRTLVPWRAATRPQYAFSTAATVSDTVRRNEARA